MINHIKSFNNFSNSNQILYVFDFDDTLVDTPSFEELAQQYLIEKLTVKDLLINSIKKIGVRLNDLKIENDRIYFEDPDLLYDVSGNWVRKGKRVYLVTPDEFSYIDESLPSTKTKFSEIYNKIENKCIVTARPEETRYQISNVLRELGFEYPKWGLHMLPKGRKNAGVWKGEKIVELVMETGVNKVVFFDDNSRYLKKAGRVVKEKLPNIIWEPYKIIE